MPRMTSRTDWAKSWPGRDICVSVWVVSPTGPSVMEVSAGKRAIQPCRMSSVTTPSEMINTASLTRIRLKQVNWRAINAQIVF